MKHVLHYTALGDSLTIGVGAYFSPGFVQRYEQFLEMLYHMPVKTDIIARNRMNSSELLMMLSEPEVRYVIARADIITITIGGNDILQANKTFEKTNDPSIFQWALENFSYNIRSILADIHAIKATHSPSKPYQILVIGLYNPYPQLSYSDYWIEKFNRSIHMLASPNVLFINIYPAFNTSRKRLLSLGVHPNGYGYQVIANLLADSLR
ncbi:GDSL-type esterase/lipase family protein [Alkalihalobacterium elongatum]|uniref:GDSL-type esterase/lipase family protein n=1 Tax=Alkalihalobacterium elongatum TaxID=2675466 RepID=UPI001C1F5137|nr:GDSL-type esterase/lipase family protein [Alkalihalobacterium elongatum]